MKKEIGEIKFPIWLLGDSNPKNWENILKVPFDSRHPIIHNIWTPIIDIIQEQIFIKCKNRINTKSIYIRNAIEDARFKPKSNILNWSREVTHKVNTLSESIIKYNPIFIFSFGSFSFEFAKRALFENSNKRYIYWGAKNLGAEFRRRINNFDSNTTNLIPLLHRSIAGGKFVQSHEYFCDRSGVNYFEIVGKSIADCIVANKNKFNVFID